MKIFDMHIHSYNVQTKPEEIIAKLEETGIYGACILSNEPEYQNKKKRNVI